MITDLPFLRCSADSDVEVMVEVFKKLQAHAGHAFSSQEEFMSWALEQNTGLVRGLYDIKTSTSRKAQKALKSAQSSLGGALPAVTSANADCAELPLTGEDPQQRPGKGKKQWTATVTGSDQQGDHSAGSGTGEEQSQLPGALAVEQGGAAEGKTLGRKKGSGKSAGGPTVAAGGSSGSDGDGQAQQEQASKQVAGRKRAARKKAAPVVSEDVDQQQQQLVAAAADGGAGGRDRLVAELLELEQEGRREVVWPEGDSGRDLQQQLERWVQGPEAAAAAAMAAQGWRPYAQPIDDLTKVFTPTQVKVLASVGFKTLLQVCWGKGPPAA
jgi:hypothetical protein